MEHVFNVLEDAWKWHVENVPNMNSADSRSKLKDCPFGGEHRGANGLAAE